MTSLTWPTDLVPNSQQFYPIFTTRQFKSPFTGASQTMEFPSCVWMCQLSFKNLNRDEMRELEVFLIQLRGAAGRFRLGDQANTQPRGLAQGAAIVEGSNQTGSVLNIRGCTANQNFLKVGDYITVNNELKRLIADANANASGRTALRFEPNLRNSPVNGAAITVRNTYAVMRLADDKQGKFKRVPMHGSVSLNLVEDVYS